MAILPGGWLAWLKDAQGNSIPIQGSCSLGRSVSNQIPLPDERVSRRHAMIQLQHEGEFWLVDFGSSNGTYLNRRRMIQPTRLRNGDLIQVGPFEFVFCQPGEAETRAQPTALMDRTVSEIRVTTCWLLVADMVDSSRLVRELPPDDLPRVTGQWVSECKQTIEACGGRINQFTGDGFFAYWHDRERIEIIVDKALQALGRLQAQKHPDFRLVVHLGQVALGGVAIGEEERVSGSEVHFVFRMEKLAGSLGERRLLSDPAWKRLAALMGAREIGAHELVGFSGSFPFYAF